MKTVSLAKAWVRWLVSCDLPAHHIAPLLDVDPAELDQWPTKPAPSGPPRKGGANIKADTARKVRMLTELGYSTPEVARVLTIRERAVRDFLRCCAPRQAGGLRRPREPKAQRALDRRERRRRERRESEERARAARHAGYARDEAAEWKAFVDAAPTVQAAELVAAQAVAEERAARTPSAPGPPLTPWTGPTSWNAKRGDNKRTRLSARAVHEIRCLFALGWTYEALAEKFSVTQHTIFMICTRRRWKHL